MTEQKPKPQEIIFDKAIRIEGGSERDAYLEKACAEDAQLLGAVQALLRYHDDGAFLDTPFFEEHITPEVSSPLENVGTSIGRYKLLEKIGEGGMAVVYMAQQEQPIRRKVALKIIKLGMDTRQVIARFEAERQALAIMDHPNIAKVLDAGATDTGRPYFVMELVQGVSITEYCDQQRLSTKDRLGLFIQVCNAIQHAHQKGIIHRDIKPTNVMVAQHEGKPVPKVIDFGIAKATNQRLTEKTLFTRYAHIIGTPAYMSPEQAELSDLDIDTRSDIYSLGVLLYELLTGATPFSEEELRHVGYVEMTRIIREQEPPRPSTRLTQMQAKSDGHPKLSTLHSPLSTDLDWIAMKALEKTRDRRYHNASALAEDVQRHLKDEPVLARSPSTTYRLLKCLRRHPVQIAAALTTTSLVVALALLFSVMQYREKQWVKDEADQHRRAVGQAEHSFYNGAIAEPLANAKRLLPSPHVGNEARLLVMLILARVREKVGDHTTEIEADPSNAKLYFSRAKNYGFLGESQKEHADLTQYAVLSDRGENTILPLNAATRLGPAVNSFDSEWMPRLSRDGLALYFQRNYLSDVKGWMATRATVQDSWNPATHEEADPKELIATFGIIPGEMPSDGSEFYYWEVKPEGYGGSDIYVFTQDTVSSVWTGPANLGDVVNSPADEIMPCISPDGLELYFSDFSDVTTPFRPGGHGKGDLWVTKRLTRDAPWQEPTNLGPGVNSDKGDARLHMSADGLLLLFDSWRKGGYGSADIYMTQRKTLKDPWGEAVNLGPAVNTPDSEFTPGISPDGRTLYFMRNDDIWQAPIVTEGGGRRTEN
jgi:serine/threonine protein kinase